MVKVTWSGRWPNLCSGEWRIFVDEMEYTEKIPTEQRRRPMNTYGAYSKWHFDKMWCEVWETYHDGLKPKEWYEANPWIAEIPAPAAEIYLAFQNKDWRHGSCGGCI